MSDTSYSSGHRQADPIDYRMRKLLEAYYEITLHLQDRLAIEDVDDVLMLVLIAVADLRGAPMDAELLAEKTGSSRSTVERRLRPYLARAMISKGRRGKSVVFLWTPGEDTATSTENSAANSAENLSAEMVRTFTKAIFEIASA